MADVGLPSKGHENYRLSGKCYRFRNTAAYRRKIFPLAIARTYTYNSFIKPSIRD